jgi:polysaccharide export outer membrane protein
LAGFPDSRIKAGDLISVVVSSLNKEEDLVFNAAGGQTIPEYSETADQKIAYEVDKSGYIIMHQLGKVKAEGLTRYQLQDKLQKDLLPYLKDPIVAVSYLNYRVSVIGDVKAPRVISIPQERISVIDALALSGDMNITARRDNLLIIREQDSGRYLKRINLEDNTLLSSNWYYLQPNDILYVSADDEKRLYEERRVRFTQNFSIILSTLSFLIVILNLLLN